MRETIRLEIFVVILASLMASIGCGAASNRGDTVIEGNIAQDVFELTAPSILQMTAAPGQPVTYELQFKINTTNSPWSIIVRSDDPDGKMRESDADGYVIPGESLTNPMHIVYGSTDETLSDGDQYLITNEASVGPELLYDVKLTQQTDVMDPILPTGHAYKILLTFTGGIHI